MDETEARESRALRVRDIMRIDVLTVVPEMTVRELIHTLLEREITGAPVISSTGKVVGVVSTTDILRFIALEPEISAGRLLLEPELLFEEGGDAPAADLRWTRRAIAPGADVAVESVLDDCQVREIMTPVPYTVSPEDTLPQLAALFRRQHIHRALVMENGVLLGIVTTWDVVQATWGEASSCGKRWTTPGKGGPS